MQISDGRGLSQPDVIFAHYSGRGRGGQRVVSVGWFVCPNDTDVQTGTDVPRRGLMYQAGLRYQTGLMSKREFLLSDRLRPRLQISTGALLKRNGGT